MLSNFKVFETVTKPNKIKGHKLLFEKLIGNILQGAHGNNAVRFNSLKAPTFRVFINDFLTKRCILGQLKDVFEVWGLVTKKKLIIYKVCFVRTNYFASFIKKSKSKCILMFILLRHFYLINFADI